MALWKPSRRTILRAGGLIAAPAIIGRAIAQVPLTGAGRGAPGGAAPSPIAFVDGVETASTNATSVTSAAINSTGANFLFAAVADFGGGTLGTIADNKGNIWSAQTTFVDGSNLSRIITAWSKPTTVGSGHTVNYTGTQPSISFAAFSNVNAAPLDNQVGTSGSASSPAGGSITPGVTNELIISAFCSLCDNTSTVSASFIRVGTPIGTSANNFAMGMAYLIQTVAAAVNPVWTISTANPWAATNAAFKN